MAEPEQHLPASAALLGGGVIGGGWAARLVLAGVDVRLFDPAQVPIKRHPYRGTRIPTPWTNRPAKAAA